MLTTQNWWFLAVALALAAALSGLRLWGIDGREREQQRRLDAFRGPVERVNRPANMAWYQSLGDLFAPMVGVSDQQRLLKLLASAGFKGQTSLAKFVAMKVLAALIGAAIAWLIMETKGYFDGRTIFRIVVVVIGLIIGWRLPEFILHRMVARRTLRLEYGMPDAIDLLVICAEAGLSLNQAVEEISTQLHISNKDIADEFAITSAEMRITPDFGKALDNLVERTGLEHLEGFVATLKQSVRFGTPLAESLRMVAGEMRAERQARIEERAARLPVLLAIPMMAFILPCILMVVGTPLVLRLMDAFSNLSFGGVSALH